MNAHIILIDDDEDDRLLFREAIKSSGYDGIFSEYASGKSFMEYMERGEPVVLPCVIFLDINMPMTDGYTLLSMIRQSEKFRDSNVVMYTTSTSNIDVLFAEQNLASGFAAKPYEYSKLEAIIQNAVQHFLPPKTPRHFFTMS